MSRLRRLAHRARTFCTVPTQAAAADDPRALPRALGFWLLLAAAFCALAH